MAMLLSAVATMAMASTLPWMNPNEDPIARATKLVAQMNTSVRAPQILPRSVTELLPSMSSPLSSLRMERHCVKGVGVK